jgi:hypothetical protein
MLQECAALLASSAALVGQAKQRLATAAALQQQSQRTRRRVRDRDGVLGGAGTPH